MRGGGRVEKSMALKVAMIGWEYPPHKVGGLGTHCYGLTRSLADMGVSIDFYMPHADKIKTDKDNLTFKGIGEEIFPYDTVNLGGDFFERVNRYNELCVKEIQKNSYGLLHCHDWLTINAGIMLKKKLNIPLVLTIHSTEYDRSGWLNSNQWFIDIEKKGMENADKIIAVSYYTRKILMKKYGVPKEKIRVIHNAVTPIGEGGKKLKIVLFMGRLTIQKGPEFFIRAAKKVLEAEDCLFVVAGAGDMLPQLVDLAVNLGISNRVMFTGKLTDEELHHIYRIAQVYVLPSVSEPFGITALEALSAGTPIIVSKSSGVSEILKTCLRVDFWDIDEMANKIVTLLRYAPLRKELAKHAKEEIKFFTWDLCARKTFDVYKEVV